jgi:hypothetical protein
LFLNIAIIAAEELITGRFQLIRVFFHKNHHFLKKIPPQHCEPAESNLDNIFKLLWCNHTVLADRIVSIFSVAAIENGLNSEISLIYTKVNL